MDSKRIKKQAEAFPLKSGAKKKCGGGVRNIGLHPSTFEQWNMARKQLSMTHDDFAIHILSFYNAHKPKSLERCFSPAFGVSNETEITGDLSQVEYMVASPEYLPGIYLDQQQQQQHHHQQQQHQQQSRVASSPSLWWDMHHDDLSTPVNVKPIKQQQQTSQIFLQIATSTQPNTSTSRYLLHSWSPCTWEPEDVFSKFHQNMITKYTSSGNIVKVEDNDYVKVEDNDYLFRNKEVEKNINFAIMQAVNDIVNEMVETVLIQEIYGDDDDDIDDDSDDDDWGSDVTSDEKSDSDDGPSSDSNHPGLDSHSEDKQLKKPICCDECGKIFRLQGLLNVHKKQVHEEKKFKCEQCQKSFINPYMLARHVRTHTNERPFKCDYCDKRFAQKCQLKCHLRVHTNEKPYKCKSCDASFAHNVSLRNHTQKHHK